MLQVAIDKGQRPVTARRLVTGLAVLGIVLIALGVRFHRISEQSLFLDEFWNLELATGRGSAHLRLPSETLLHDVPRVTSRGIL